MRVLFSPDFPTRFARRQQTKYLRGARITRSINYTREANLSESIIIAACQNYVLTLRKAQCSRRSTPWLITATRSFYHFFRSSGSIIPCNVIYEASGFDEAGRWNGVITSLFRSRSDNFSSFSFIRLFYFPLVLIMPSETYVTRAFAVLYDISITSIYAEWLWQILVLGQTLITRETPIFVCLRKKNRAHLSEPS